MFARPAPLNGNLFRISNSASVSYRPKSDFRVHAVVPSELAYRGRKTLSRLRLQNAVLDTLGTWGRLRDVIIRVRTVLLDLQVYPSLAIKLSP